MTDRHYFPVDESGFSAGCAVGRAMVDDLDDCDPPAISFLAGRGLCFACDGVGCSLCHRGTLPVDVAGPTIVPPERVRVPTLVALLESAARLESPLTPRAVARRRACQEAGLCPDCEDTGRRACPLCKGRGEDESGRCDCEDGSVACGCGAADPAEVVLPFCACGRRVSDCDGSRAGCSRG